MAQTINDFINKVGNYGIARNNKFEVLLPNSLVSNVVLPSGRDLASYYAESVEIPGKLINTTPTRLHGKVIERPMEFIYEGSLNITFLLDARLQVRNYFESWLNIVLPNGDNVSFNPSIPEKYLHTMTVNVVENINQSITVDRPTSSVLDSFQDGLLSGGKTSPKKADTTEKVVGSYTFFKIYPKAVSGTNLISSGREFQRVKVTFEFDYMQSTFPENNPAQSVAPDLSTGYGSSINGALNGIANNVGKTVGGTLNAVQNSTNSISRILGL